MSMNKNADITLGMRLFEAAADSYRAVFARSPLAPYLSRPAPVRHTGYDIEVRVERIRDEAEGVRSFELAPADPEVAELPSWRPGAHLDLFLPSGLQRSYSLNGDVDDRSTYRIAVRRIPDGDGGSKEMHSLSEGDTLTIRGPRNAFPFHDTDSYLFVAGGIGITPILPMIRHAARNGAEWRLAYLGRSRDSLPFLDELAELDPDGSRVVVRPDDEFGRPDIVHILGGAAKGAAIYMCGPPPLMTTARGVISGLDPTASLHTERFSPARVAGGEPFSVLIAGTKERVEVGSDETMLEAIRRVVPGVKYSCRQGFCSSCMTKVIAGDVDHRDKRLTDAEREDYMLTCVSRAASPQLTIDL
ncbi:PDR/VanB family oxidoreductase [Dietzia sp.]|uniref:PDR/VanB family oxidoreductase n=1 Tax=Dietzia sp. TaxID=1871616 RepID=UPI002FD9660D